MMNLPPNLDDYTRIEQAIHYLRDHQLHQPSLDELSQHLQLSPTHLQKLFRRWAGISPKRFLQFLTIEHAKHLLASEPVLSTSFSSGLSGGGRLHDLFVNVEAVTPGEYRRRGAGLTIQYGFHPSPFGECLLAVTERGICWLAFVCDHSPEAVLTELRHRFPLAHVQEQPTCTQPYLAQIFPTDSDTRQPKLTLFLNGTNFQLQVWQALLRIPSGYLTSYGALATAIGHPTASRAVGAAVGANPISFLIPCHRVLRSDGNAHQYAWGVTRKQAMLGWEAAQRFGEGE
ncbi:MAG TPA: bifunctional helix-turn-helix domain-containing protein/methylated-DNA--[protein]-cysteine S-methyltransferase [Anaerolineales bacterium]|nr:bifunctional helix-turn-helix domain-containing protein/methylated-DNA--[protein]-cysteine S-methyltransferase [Anaerolineales bacterium]